MSKGFRAALRTAVMATVVLGGTVGLSPAASSFASAGVASPTITGFSPASGLVGTVVTIKGTNLDGATKVAFNNLAATIAKDTATTIKVTVPVGVATGKIKVVTPGGKAKSATSFTVPTTVSFDQASSLYQGGPVDLTLNQPSTTTVVVSFSTSGAPPAATQSAEWLGSPQSFSPRSGTVTFAHGQTSATISFTVLQPTVTGCSAFASNCLPSLEVALSHPRNASLGSTPVTDLYYWG